MSLNDKFKVALIPIDIAQAEVEANLVTVESAIAGLSEGVDLVVLPELFSTGYINNRPQALELAQPVDGMTIQRLKSIASSYRLAICGSFLSKDGDDLFNRGFFVEPNGDVAYYNKRHLFCISKEADVCKHGDSLPPVIRYRGWNLMMAICYDVRFPVWLRNVNNKYDALIVPANWPDKREFAWRHLLQARAIENQAYVLAANRSGCDHYGCYDDLTFVFDYMGQPIGKHIGAMVEATLDRQSLRRMRTDFPVWRDADIYRISD